MRILFIGIPDMGLVCLNALIENKKNIVAIVPPVKSHNCYKLMTETAKSYNIPVIGFEKSPKEESFLNAIRNIKPDIAIVCSFTHLLPIELINIPKLGIINCHPSLLPHYRGANPYFHVINNGETHTGVTLHYMDEGFDTGDMISQRKIPITPDETIGTIFNKLNYHSVLMINEILDKIEKGETPVRHKQDKTSSFITSPKISPEKGDAIIDWSQDAQAIERFVRACNPFFGAMACYRGVTTKIWSGSYTHNINITNAPDGSIIKVSKDKLVISTGKGVFMPETIQFGTYMITDIKDFIKRTNPKVGEVLEGR